MIEGFTCPACGAALPKSILRTKGAICDYCGTPVKIDSSALAGVICEKNTGKPLAQLFVPDGWDISYAGVNYSKATMTYPYEVGIGLTARNGATISYSSGEGFEQMGMVGIIRQQSAYTVQRPFVPVAEYLDHYVIGMMGNGNISFVEERPYPMELDVEQEKARVRAELEAEIARARSMNPMANHTVKGVYFGSTCRIYHTGDGRMIAAAACEEGSKASMFGGMGDVISNAQKLFGGFGDKLTKMEGVPGASHEGMTTMQRGMSGGNEFLGKMADKGLLGGMLGKKIRNQRAQQSQMMQENFERPMQGTADKPWTDNVTKQEETMNPSGNTTCSSGAETMTRPGQGESLGWKTSRVFLLMCEESVFEAIYQGDFTDICSSFEIHPSVLDEQEQMRRQMQYSGNQAIMNQAAMEQQTIAARQQATRQFQQASAARNAAWSQNYNTSFERQRSAYQNRMDAQDRMRDKFSEATRGVNTYIRPDGSEVEVSVSADSAWINGKGQITYGSAGYDPGEGWTRMEKK